MVSVLSLPEKWSFRELLLSADPSEVMVGLYLSDSEMFVWRDDDGRAVAEAVVDFSGEIRNLAIAPECQGRGVGRLILDDLCAYYKSAFSGLTVGTSEAGVGFYERCGFRYSRTVRGFFTDNYPEPIIENGVRCVDMILLIRES